MNTNTEKEVSATKIYENLLHLFNEGTNIDIEEEEYIEELLKKFYLKYHKRREVNNWVTYFKVNKAEEILRSTEEFILRSEHKILIETNYDFSNNKVNLEVILLEDPVHPGIFRSNFNHPRLQSQKYYYKKVMPFDMDEEVVATNVVVNEF